MRRRGFALPIFFVLLLSSIAFSDDVESVVHFNAPSPYIVLTQFNVTPDALTQGQTADFSLTIQNTGIGAGTVNASVYIYNSLGALVSNFRYDPVVVAAGGTTIVVKTWDSDSLPAGIYTAYANASYLNNVTNRLNASFTIASIPPTPPGPGGGGGGGGAGAGKPKPQPVPETIVPVGEGIFFAKIPAVKEVLAGEGDLESATLLNNAKENVSVDIRVDGAPEGWITLVQNRSVILDGETRVINFRIAVPKDALSGNYLVKFEAEGYGYYARDYMLLRVKNYPKWHQYPIYLKTIRTNLVDKETDVYIRLKNPSESNIKALTAKETIPQSLKRGPLSIDFFDKRGVVENIGGTNVITWNVSDFGPLEEMTISYSLKNTLSDYHEYAVWYLRQMDVGGRLDLSSLVRIVDLSSQTISPGGSGDVTATILYAGEDPLDVTASLELPAGFSADPGYAGIVLIPRGLTNVKFRITAPKDVQQTHLIRAIVMGKDFNVYSAAPIVVRKGEGGSGTGSMVIGGDGGSGAGTTIASLSLPWLDLAVAFIAFALGLVVLLVIVGAIREALTGAGGSGMRKPMQKPIYDFERVKDLGVIRRIISGSVKGDSGAKTDKKYLI